MAFSCDTFVCMKDETDGAYTALCKNSDRHPNEAHEVVIVPEIKIDDSTIIECTYTKVSPPKSHSHRCLLSKPVWMWGAEMGSNSAGVCIGNEAAFPNSKANNKNILNGNTRNEYLTGMDLLRLALMFGDSALDAVKIIDHYLQHYVQGGCMQWMNIGESMYYSTYLIADYDEVWIVETINQWFVAKKYCHGIHAISNRYSMSAPFDMISTSLREYCDEHNIDWKQDLDIYNQFGQWKMSYLSDSYNRQCYVQHTLQQISLNRKLNINDFTNILRSHQIRYPIDTDTDNDNDDDDDDDDDENKNYCPTGIDKGILGIDICAHCSYGPIRSVNTTGSLICIMRRDGMVLNFVTATSTPCISIFKPIYIRCTIPKKLGVGFRKFCNGNFIDLGKKKKNNMIQTYDNLLKKKNDIISTSNMLIYNNKSNKKQLWWKHEIFHRLYLKYFINDNKFNKYIKNKINQFEKNMFNKLIDQYNEYNYVHSTDHEIYSHQQKITDKYWMESYKILDEILKETQNEIDIINENKENNNNNNNNIKNIGNKIVLLLSMIFNGFTMITRYLHQTQWIYLNKLAGIHISKNGMVNDSKRLSVSSSLSFSSWTNSFYQMFCSLFNGNNSLYQWIKLIITSIWSVLLLAIGWKMLN